MRLRKISGRGDRRLEASVGRLQEISFLRIARGFFDFRIAFIKCRRYAHLIIRPNIFRPRGSELGNAVRTIFPEILMRAWRPRAFWMRSSPDGRRNDSNDMPGTDEQFTIRRISNNKITEQELSFVTPYETDYQISPTGKLVIGRLMSKDHGQAFAFAWRDRMVRQSILPIPPRPVSSV